MLNLALVPKTAAQFQQLQPAWSPDGRSFAYLSNETGQFQLYLRELKTNTIQQISQAKEDILQFKWSPTGQKLAYLSGETLTVMENDGTESMRLMTSPANPLFFAWHPRGRGLTYTCAIKGEATDICLKNLYNHFDINLTEDPGLDRNFAWSPDGTQLVFGSDRAGKPDLYLLNLPTQELRRLTDLPGNTLDPVFAPNGRYIAFVADQDGTDQHFAVYVLDLEQNELLRLSDTRGNHQPLWFPDSQYLLINTNSQGAWEYYRVRRDGSERERLGDGLVCSIHPDGKKLLVQAGGNGFQSIQLVNLK